MLALAYKSWSFPDKQLKSLAKNLFEQRINQKFYKVLKALKMEDNKSLLEGKDLDYE